MNVADLQTATVRALFVFSELAPLLAERPAAALAQRVLPEYPGPIPPALPPEWVAVAAAPG